PGLANGVRAIAALYDMQHDPALRDEMTYVSPTSGERVGLSFIVPHTREELERRRVMMLLWARATCGMMGRSPDFMNVTFAAWSVNFGVPVGTPGLRFLCRESFDLGRSHFDHPLGSRFEEMDCVVFFDDVLVPWERVFVLGDVDLINGTAMTTHSAAHTAHQN